jgi:hypothetical protein
MRPECPHEARSFLAASGELGGLEGLLGKLHTARCSLCRAEVERLRAHGTTLRRVLGPAGTPVAAPPRKVLTLGLAWVAAACVLATLWVMGKEAVRAAEAAAHRPQMRQATFEDDREGVRR